MKWFVTGQRVKRWHHASGEFRYGTVVIARGDFSDVVWDDNPDWQFTVSNDSLTRVEKGEES